MARSLDAIIKELDAGYNPGRQAINERISGLGERAQNEISALKAQEQDYFDNTIMTGARARGLGFSGIPEGERARYGSTHFLPAIARVEQSKEDTRLSLLDRLNDLNMHQRNAAMGLRQDELNREAQERAEQRRLQAQIAANRSIMPILPSGGGGGGAGGGGSSNDDMKRLAAIEIQNMLGRRGTESFYREIKAIAKSAGYGNVKDQAKMELLAYRQPGLFQGGQLNEGRLNQLIMRSQW